MKRTTVQMLLWLFNLHFVTALYLNAQSGNSIKAIHAALPSSGEIQELKVGDIMPPVKVENVFKFGVDYLQFPSAKGKCIVLNFFATWCTPCISELPLLDSLQKEFKNEIQIFIVSYESKSKINNFLKTNRIAASVSLPVIAEDSLLRTLFPHTAIPHNVWIDQQNIVKGITSSIYLTRSNVRDFIAHKKLNLPVKKELIGFDSKKPFFLNGNGGNGENFKTRSIITGYIDGLVATWGVSYSENEKNLLSRIYAVNSSILNLYMHALNRNNLYYPKNRIILNIKDKDRFFSSEDWETWRTANSFCYELTVPPTSSDNIHRYMMDDLRRYFSIEVVVEKRMTKCLILIADADKVKKAYSKGGKEDSNLYEKNSLPKFINNKSVSTLVEKLNVLYEFPVLDETNIACPIDLVLPVELKNLAAVKSALHDYGFDLVEREREIEMLVFNEF